MSSWQSDLEGRQAHAGGCCEQDHGDVALLHEEEGAGSARMMSMEGNEGDHNSPIGKPLFGTRGKFIATLAFILAICGCAWVFSSGSQWAEAPVEADEEDSTDLMQVIHKNGKKYYSDCGNTYELEKVTHSNLGGHGPDSGPENITWVAKHMFLGEFLGYIDIVMVANKPYTAWHDVSLNGMHGEFGRVALPSGVSLDAYLEFQDHETKKPIMLPEITMTFYDIDQGWDHTAVEYVRVITEHKTMLKDNAAVDIVKLPDGSIKYTANQLGNKEDNPLRPDDLTPLMKRRALAFTITNKTKFEFEFGSSDGKFDRGFFFAFMNAMNCRLIEITSSTTTTTTTSTTTSGKPIHFPWWILAVIAAIIALCLLFFCLKSYYRRLTFTERKTMVKNRFIRQVNRAAEILGSPNPNYNDPELKAILKKLNDNKQHVKAMCNNPWVEWQAPGSCQVCRTDVDRKEKGLQCASGGHRICWNCMCHNMDWDTVCDSELAALKDDTEIWVWDCDQK